MEKKGKHCYACAHLERFYTKGQRRFQRTEIGWCFLKRESVDVRGCCERFQVKKTKRESIRLLRAYLNDLLTEISELRCFLEDEQNEE